MLGRLKPLALLLPVLLWGCILTPGKFVSTLDIAADRSFAFTYVGEVWAVDMEAPDGDAKDAKSAEDIAKDKAKTAETERKNAAIADSLRKEAGYRKVEYLGGGRFTIDYAISGRLTHNFIYPFNIDAQAVFPFIALELRGRDTVRVKAPAFANDSDAKGMSGMGGMTDSGKGTSDKLDGVFTLTTNAEIVSQNSEDGAAATGARKTIVWKANPLTKDAPMAVLRVAPLG